LSLALHKTSCWYAENFFSKLVYQINDFQFDFVLPLKTRHPAVKVPAKPSASHYHLKMECLAAAAADFDPKNIVLPQDVKSSLTPQHYTVLSKFGLQ